MFESFIGLVLIVVVAAAIWFNVRLTRGAQHKAQLSFVLSSQHLVRSRRGTSPASETCPSEPRPGRFRIRRPPRANAAIEPAETSLFDAAAGSSGFGRSRAGRAGSTGRADP